MDPVAQTKSHVGDSGSSALDRRWQRLRARGLVLRDNTIDLIARSRRAVDRSRALLRNSRIRIVRDDA
jgi:hypothetical protein